MPHVAQISKCPCVGNTNHLPIFLSIWAIESPLARTTPYCAHRLIHQRQNGGVRRAIPKKAVVLADAIPFADYHLKTSYGRGIGH